MLFHDTYDNIGEYLTQLEDSPIAWQTKDLASMEKKSESFVSTTYEKTFDLALRGWPEGRERMSEVVKSMEKITMIGKSPTMEYDVYGFMPEIPRAIVGLPDSMVRNGCMMQRSKPIIGIIINAGNSWSVTETSMM